MPVLFSYFSFRLPRIPRILLLYLTLALAGCVPHSDRYYSANRKRPDVPDIPVKQPISYAGGQSSVSTPVTPSPPPPAVTKIKIKIKIEDRRQIALIIGINNYVSWTKLQNAVPDAKGVAKVLRNHYGFTEVVEIYDAEATKKNIMERVRQIVESMKGGEDIFIYFSGHGHYDDTLERGYWVPVDAKDESAFLPNSEIHDYIKAMDKKGVGNVFLVADSCFAGSFLGVTRELRAIGVRPPELRDEKKTATYLERLHATPSRTALTSGSNEPVPDGGAEGHSVFAYYLLRALTKPDYPSFTSSELSAKVQRDVGFNSDQTPRLGVIKFAGHAGGEFVFVKND